MTKEQIIQILIEKTKELLPELEKEPLSGTHSLRDVGANSLDRADIIMMTLEELDMDLPLVKLSNAKNIEGLAMVIFENA